MSAPEFTSVFADDLKRYLAFKQGMGCYGAARGWYLSSFDVYCTEHGVISFDRQAVEGWVVFRKSSQPGSQPSWMSYIRDFGRWMRAQNDPDAYVLTESWRSGFVRSQPYLLSREEISRFFQAAAELKTNSPWQWQSVAFFGLMHSCGLRTCETRRLRLKDVDLGKGEIDVLWSKGNRSRRLPITDEVIDILAECDRMSRKEFGRQRPRFFVSSTPAPVPPASIGVMFNRIWDRAGLVRSSSGNQPHPYSFRHHFAYANIERWMAEGIDVNAMLPYLARYMGHASLDSRLRQYITGLHGWLRSPHPGWPRRISRGGIRMKNTTREAVPDFWGYARNYLHQFLPQVRNLAPRSIEAYRISLESYIHYLVTEKQVPRQTISFDDFDRQVIKDWLVWMRQSKDYEPATIGLRLSAIKAFLSFAAAEEITLVAVYQAAKTLKAPATPRKPIEYLQENETTAVLAAYNGQDLKSRRNRMLLILLYDSGARVGEITALTVDDLKLSQPAHLILTGKRDKSRVVPLGEKTVEHLLVYLEEFHPLMPTSAVLNQPQTSYSSTWSA